MQTIWYMIMHAMCLKTRMADWAKFCKRIKIPLSFRNQGTVHLIRGCLMRKCCTFTATVGEGQNVLKWGADSRWSLAIAIKLCCHFKARCCGGESGCVLGGRGATVDCTVMPKPRWLLFNHFPTEAFRQLVHWAAKSGGHFSLTLFTPQC